MKRLPLGLLSILTVAACGAAEATGNDDALDGGGSMPNGADGGYPIHVGEAGAPVDGGTGNLDGSVFDSGPVDAGPPPPPMPHQAMLVGYDEAWIGPYSSDLTQNFSLPYVRSILDGIHAGGGHIVRLWLFEGLQGITLAQFAPQTLSVSTTMLANVETVLQEARARGIWVYVTGLNGNDMPLTAGTTRDYYYNLMNNKYGEGDAFQTNVLTPLLTLLDKHQDVVWGMDVVNEIEAAQNNQMWGDPVVGARAFIQRTALFIHAKSPWLKVTISAGFGSAQSDLTGGLFTNVGLDFYDFHTYSDDGSLAATALCNKAASDGVPIVIGEYGQLTQSEDDTLQKNVTTALLANAKAACFKAVLGWRFDASEKYWHYTNADGGPRPAVSVVQQYGALP